MHSKTTCSICKRQRIGSNSPYCLYHDLALKKVKEGYEVWKGALGMLSWERYLEIIFTLNETGDWAKEVAAHEMVSSGRGLPQPAKT